MRVFTSSFTTRHIENALYAIEFSYQCISRHFTSNLNFDRVRSYSTYCEKPLLADLLQNRLHDMHENWHFIAPSLGDQNALLKMRVQ